MLKGYQKKYLKAMAHGLKPVVIVGQKGVSESFVQAVEDALNTHELIKVKFNEYKEKKQKMTLTEQITTTTGSELAALIGHTAILYRRHPDPDKRKIQLPHR
jgi:RNA-binding protein